MAGVSGLTFTDDDIEVVLAAALSLDNDAPIPIPISNNQDWDNLKSLKRDQIKTTLHGTIMAGDLRANIAPQGLIVKNKPFIFCQDLAVKKDWSLISWHCTRDWLVLIIKTATRLDDELKTESKTIEIRLHSCQTIKDLKTRLDQLNKEMSDFEITLKQSKVNKLSTDISRFTLENVYPYT